MSRIPSRPPRVAEKLLSMTLPRDARDAITGDLREVHLRVQREHGRTAAALWYWREAVLISTRLWRETRGEARAEKRHRRRATGLAAAVHGLSSGWLDLKIGARRLIKHPVLSIVGAIAIATTIGVCAGFRDFVGGLLKPEISIPGSAKIVRLLNWDAEESQEESRILWDLERWHGSLRSVEDIGALIPYQVNLLTSDGLGTPIRVAEMSATGFEILGVPPTVGRWLQSSDEEAAAESVVVIGHGLWQTHFGGEDDIVGTPIRLGTRVYTIVGIMPKDFRFPLYQQAWLPFRRHHVPHEPRSGPEIMTFGRLPAGISIEEAQAEFSRVGAQASGDRPETHEHLRATVRPFVQSLVIGDVDRDVATWGMFAANSFFVMLLIVACTTMGTIVFARTAASSAEITIRAALGASRVRIVTQVFVEALLLSTAAGLVGLFVANRVLMRGSEVFWAVQYMQPPPWWNPGISVQTFLYAMTLAVLAAVVVGVLPALRATGGQLHRGLQRQGTGSLRFGFSSTAVIVCQIAIATCFLPIALSQSVGEWKSKAVKERPPTFPVEEYLGARLRLDRTARRDAGDDDGREATLRRYHQMRRRLADALLAEPEVRTVTFTNRLAGIHGQSIPRVTLRAEGDADQAVRRVVLSAAVDDEFFQAAGLSLLAGRAFATEDFRSGSRVAIVNQSFVRTVLDGRNPVGTRVWVGEASEHSESAPDTPVEIVGLVADEFTDPEVTQRLIYFPIDTERDYPMRMMVRVVGEPTDFFPRLRAIATAAAPGILTDELISLSKMRRDEVASQEFVAMVVVLIAVIVLALSGAGVYALMSFTVSQRTREIGIRRALGAQRVNVMRQVFARTFLQLGSGVAVGAILAVMAARAGALDERSFSPIGLFILVAVLMMSIGAAASLAPLLRGLRVEPTVALRLDG